MYLKVKVLKSNLKGRTTMSFVLNNTVFTRISQDKSQIVDKEISNDTKSMSCRYCKGSVHILAKAKVTLRDMPEYPGKAKRVRYHIHRYQCEECGKTFTEEIESRYPGTRVTRRAAEWIKALLKNHMTIRGVQRLTGIHWDTIRRIHEEIIKETVERYEESLRKSDYRPKYLAVDEFAIHKGHKYATCVMDLDTGHVIWVGKGRAKDDFERFFRETDMTYLSEVKAVAMDMNASYNLLVEKYLLEADIVYDRYHMQSQYGKDVLGVVRLQEAKEHKLKSEEYRTEMKTEQNPVKKRELKEKARYEQTLYSKTKKGRWLILKNPGQLNESGLEALQDILDRHTSLSLCYAMKEEMRDAFYCSSSKEAEILWKKWFKAAKESEIPALKRFAEIKEKRIPGLIAHSKHNISTGPLEGLNNKIKVSKRIAYGYRDEKYFFSLIRYITIPEIRYS